LLPETAVITEQFAAVASSGLIGAMTVLGLLVGVAILVQYGRKIRRGDDDDDDFDDDDESDFDLSSTQPSISEDPQDTTSETELSLLGVPSFRWGGQDNGKRMKVEVAEA
jgi:hypothetical protein